MSNLEGKNREHLVKLEALKVQAETACELARIALATKLNDDALRRDWLQKRAEKEKAQIALKTFKAKMKREQQKQRKKAQQAAPAAGGGGGD